MEMREQLTRLDPAMAKQLASDMQQIVKEQEAREKLEQ